MNFFVVLLVLAVVSIICVWLGLRSKDRRLSSAAKKLLRAQWEHVQSIDDPAHKVLEAEKVLDGALRELGVGGSFGEKLKTAGSRFKNIESLWQAHKLRNRIAHEPGT